MEGSPGKSSIRNRANEIKLMRCRNLVAVIENPRDSINIGTIVRNIDALGVEKTYVIDESGVLPVDWEDMRDDRLLNKISVSAIKRSFVKVFSSTQVCIDHLSENNYFSIATSPHMQGKDNFLLHEGIYTQRKLAIWFGNESYGLSSKAIENSKFCINIPMCGFVESLNLATATGIVFYEVTKQRRAYIEEKFKTQDLVR